MQSCFADDLPILLPKTIFKVPLSLYKSLCRCENLYSLTFLNFAKYFLCLYLQTTALGLDCFFLNFPLQWQWLNSISVVVPYLFSTISCIFFMCIFFWQISQVSFGASYTPLQGYFNMIYFLVLLIFLSILMFLLGV